MEDPTRPNVLFIALDDLNGWLGCMGTNPDVRTPHMDRLADRGMLFTNACCASPVCQPSRTAILTGLQPSTTGCYLLNDRPQDSPPAREALPLPLHFRHNGYRTMCVGKVDHGDLVDKATREVRNESMWDEHGGWFDGQQFGMKSPHTSCMTDVPGYYRFAFHWGPLDGEQAEGLSDRRVARWAEQRLKRDYDGPFFLAAGFFRPHVPLIAPRRFFEMYDKDALTLPAAGPYDFDDMPPVARQVALAGYQDFEKGMHYQITEHGYQRDVVRAYLASVSFVDHCVGRVLNALEEGPHADNTVVVLWSDNGWSLGEHFHWKKWSLWDCGARVPLIIRAPGTSAGGGKCAEGVSLADLYPTLVDLCGLPEVPNLEGRSLGGLLSGEQGSRERPALTCFGPNNHSLRTRRWRYTRYCDGSEELYDYETDEGEHANLAADPECESVKESLAKWLPAEPVPAPVSSPPPGATLRPEPGDQVWFRGVEDGFADRKITIRATVQAGAEDGVIVHHGGWFSGYALYVGEGRLSMAVRDVSQPLRWDQLGAREAVVTADTPLPDEAVEVEGCLETDGTVALKVDGRLVGSGRADGPLSLYPAGLLEAGRYKQTGYPPIGEYETSEEFPGTLRDIRITYG